MNLRQFSGILAAVAAAGSSLSTTRLDVDRMTPVTSSERRARSHWKYLGPLFRAGYKVALIKVVL